MPQTRNGLNTGPDGNNRCWWCGDDPLYMAYHDKEWGRKQTNDIRLFEKICLEGFQAGLSWITILRKRDNFRAAFEGFDFNKIAKYDEQKIASLLQNKGIIRHEGKIRSTINNAKRMQELLQEYPSFYQYLQQYSPSVTSRPKKADYETLHKITMSEESKALSKDLKKRGFSFVGPTTMYAFIQSMGMVNDHLEGCFIRKVCE